MVSIKPKPVSLDSSSRQLDLFKLIIASMTEGVLVVTIRDEIVVYANSSFEKKFGYAGDEIVGMPAAIINFNTDKKVSERMAEEVMEQLDNFGKASLDVQNVKKDGYSFWNRVNIVQMDHPQFGQVFVLVFEDISTLKNAENNLNESIRRLAESGERSRISNELHDEFGQSLTILKMDLCELNKLLVGSTPSHNERVTVMEKYVSLLIEKARTIATDLRPSILNDHGLEEGIKCLVNDLKSRSGKVINLVICLDGHCIDQQISTALFRIVQESLTNILRYSNSEKVDVELSNTKTGFALSIRDYNELDSVSFNLVGVEVGVGVGVGLGISVMRERATSLGGQFSIFNDGGVVVKVSIPYKEIA